MTNEEKAKEIAKETLSDLATSFLGWIDEMSEFFCEESAKRMAEWKDKNPSDETIMRILNCIGYEEESWIEFVRKRL